MLSTSKKLEQLNAHSIFLLCCMQHTASRSITISKALKADTKKKFWHEVNTQHILFISAFWTQRAEAKRVFIIAILGILLHFQSILQTASASIIIANFFVKVFLGLQLLIQCINSNSLPRSEPSKQSGNHKICGIRFVRGPYTFGFFTTKGSKMAFRC